MESFDLRLWPDYASAGGDMSEPAMIEHVAIDSRRIDSSKTLFIALQGSQDGHRYVSHAAKAGCRFAIVRKDWSDPSLPDSIKLLRVETPLHAFQEIAKAYLRHLSIPVIAVIGSYGKTMVKDLLHAMLSRKYRVAASPESFNSQIGVPLSLLTINRGHEIALIEAAFSKPNELEALSSMMEPSCAILTHIGKKHQSTTGGIAATALECAKLLQLPTKGNWVILPEDPLLAPHYQAIQARRCFWNSASKDLPHAHFVPSQKGRAMTFRVDFPDGTRHLGHIHSGFYYFLDLVNITAKAAWLLGAGACDISEALSRYEPEPMRTEIWKSPLGATFINDTYCSDPQSVDLALRHFDLSPPQGRKIFLFHGIRGAKEQRAAHYERIGKALSRTRIDQLVLVGADEYSSLVKEARQRPDPLDVEIFASLSEAYQHLHATLKRDDVVLVKGQNKRHLDEITEAFNDSITNNQCIINLAAVAANLEAVKAKLSEETRLMVMVKALAYGTDDVRMASFLTACGIDILGVSYVDEAAALRRAGVKTSIFVLNAGLYEAAKIAKWDLEVGVSERSLIDALNQAGKNAGRQIRVHLHVDTGMSRLGCRPKEALALAQHISELEFLKLEGIMTHFASSEDPAEDSFTLGQAAIFAEVINTLKANGIAPRWKHAANSSAALRFDFPEFNMARIGLAAYGLHASPTTQKALELRLAFSLTSRIVGINICKNGETVSYGRSYKVHKDEQRIAVLPIGYFDGLHRNYSGKGHVIIRGCQATMVGRITMDYMMVDVTDIPHAAIGDPVLLFGEDEYGHYVAPEDFAFKVDSIPHELITCLGPRIQRVFVYEEALEKRNIPGAPYGIIQEVTSTLEAHKDAARNL